jgi:D-alanyl-D-alanine carboxypeptidase/D-alanyl-D-alanine-endopeptidase (penicillin-binding protein 4)
VRRIVAVIALTLLLDACAARKAPAIIDPGQLLLVSPEAEQLAGDLDILFSAPPTEHAQWAVAVTALATREPLYRLNAGRFMVPASVQKILTTAVAAERLGWDYRFTTRVLATGPIGADGTLEGDLIIVSNGDPTINPRHPERWRVFDEWAAALAAQGVKIVSGQIVGDDNAFAEPGWGAGWAWDDLQYGYAAPVSALQFNENQVELLIGPGMEAGARAIISTSPPGSGLVVDHGVTTAAAGTATSLDIARMPGTMLLQVRGQIAADAKPTTMTAAVDNPTRFYVHAFREALARHGIFVSGAPIDIDDLRGPPRTSAATEVIVDHSPPLGEIVDVTMKWSRNLYAETLLYALSPAGEPATGARGLEAIRETLSSWGIVPDSYRPRDGSGLSRYDYVSAEMMIHVLEHIAGDSKHAELFRAALPVGGISGTLATRLKGTPAEGRVFAKTGSMSNIRALSGYITTVDGHPLVFSILVNNYRVPTADIDAIVDKALVRLVQFKR